MSDAITLTLFCRTYGDTEELHVIAGGEPRIRMGNPDERGSSNVGVPSCRIQVDYLPPCAMQGERHI